MFLMALVGHAYHVYVLWSEPSHAGFNLVSRSRQYCVLVNKLRCAVVNDVVGLYEQIALQLAAAATQPGDCLVADDDEVIGESLEYESKRRHFRAKRAKLHVQRILWES